jgi:hypothetical protein
MAPEEITKQLQDIASTDDFAEKSAVLAESWESADAGIDTIEPILRFMVENPALDFGMPGALVHFVERFYGKGNEEKLIESVERKPIAHTVWMLNRVINGTKILATKQNLIAVMERVKTHSRADQNTVQSATRFLERLRPLG